MLKLRAASFLLIFCALTNACPAFAQEVVPAGTAPADTAQTATTPAPQHLTVLQAIQQAKSQLNALVALRDKTRPEPYAVSGTATVNLTLAVWNRTTDAITLVTAKKSGARLTSISPPMPITVSYNAKLESQYALPPDTNSLVVGVIYPIITAHAITRRKIKYMATDMVYVPYSADFYTPEMLSAGSNYLSFLIQDAYDELRAKGIKSRAFPDQLVTDVIDPYLVKSIAVIEHSGIKTLLGDDASEAAIGQFLVQLAANGETTFSTSVSSAGAAGLVQFIPSTYALMVKTRPDLGLIPNFRDGMADHKNAVMAQVAYIDEDLADMPAVRAIYQSDKAKAAEYLAASYNGGSTRVQRAYATFGDDWDKSVSGEIASLNSKAASLKYTATVLKRRIAKGKDVKASKTALVKATSERAQAIASLATLERAGLKDETVYYVAKLKRAYDMFTAGYFATPSAPTGALPAAQVAAAATSAGQTTSVATTAGTQTICFGDGSCAATQ
jgi:hypothetical protein